MTQYRCVKRLKTADGVIHEIDSTLDLNGVEEQSAIRQSAVVAPTNVTAPTASQTSVVSPVPSPSPNLAQLQQQAAQIENEIATMEHEGGTPS